MAMIMEVEAFIQATEMPQRALLQSLHDHLMAYPGMTVKIRYNIPFYYKKSWICYLNPVKGAGVELAFTRGSELSNANGALESQDRKQVAGIVYHQLEEIDFQVLEETIQEALLLDKHVPYASKRKPKK